MELKFREKGFSVCLPDPLGVRELTENPTFEELL
jgi:hypothetical protein